jgi:hypothetical protein
MVEQLQTPQNRLLTAVHERHNLIGTEKTMPVNEPDYLSVACRQLQWADSGSAFKAGKTGLHRSILLDPMRLSKASILALCGKDAMLREKLTSEIFICCQAPWRLLYACLA